MIEPKPSPSISIGSALLNGTGVRSRIPVPVSRGVQKPQNQNPKEPRKLPPLLSEKPEEKPLKRETTGPPRFRPPEVDINSLMSKFSSKPKDAPVQSPQLAKSSVSDKEEILRRHKDLVSIHQAPEKFPSPPPTPKQPPSGFQPVGNAKPRPFGFLNPSQAPAQERTPARELIISQENQLVDDFPNEKVLLENEEKEWNERYKHVRDEHMNIFEEQEQLFEEVAIFY
jgi:hypothetical protein